jgi:hypothetical protein
VLVELQARRCPRKQSRQGRFSTFELLAPQVITVQLNEIEGPHEHAIIVPAVANALKQCDAVLTSGFGPLRPLMDARWEGSTAQNDPKHS